MVRDGDFRVLEGGESRFDLFGRKGRGKVAVINFELVNGPLSESVLSEGWKVSCFGKVLH